MEEALKIKTYKSPRRKLLVFFEKSRNQWKTKCQEAKKALKLLKNKIRFLEIIQKAMETVPTKKIPEWCSEKIGQSVQSKRKRAFVVKDNEEQKWDQLRLAG